MTKTRPERIESTLMSLADIVAKQPAWRFSVPIYQRPYVWGDDQVKTLLDDLVNAWQSREQSYFLGGVLLMDKGLASGKNHCDFELIDGQQRFTTLWLIAQRWQHALAPFVAANPDSSDEPRLTFAIRDSLNRFLQNLMRGQTAADGRIHVENKDMGKALARIDNVLQAKGLSGQGHNEINAKIAALSAFIYRNVKLVVTTVPGNTDLNKLFEVINNRGMQLQHHEILKARLLGQIEPGERGVYAAMWDACADMDSYIEHSFAAATKKQANEVCALFEQGVLFDGKCIAENLGNESQDSDKPFSLTDILEGEDDQGPDNTKRQDAESHATSSRSIFGFPLYLQHALRIWLHIHNHDDLPRVLDRKLLELFAGSALGHSNNSDDIRSFLQLMFRLRVLFDQYVIKWVDQGEEELHQIKSANPTNGSDGKRYLRRFDEPSTCRPLAMLQSMLYHSQEITTQYWITPLLLYLHRRSANLPNNRNVDDIIQWLRHLDTHMFSSDSDDDLIDRSHAFMCHPWAKRNLAHRQALTQPKGLEFSHYWFYKLEFVLWYQNHMSDRPDTQWQKFRLTAKNSIEHVSPQTAQTTDTNTVETELHSFGNLALVSRGINSEYGNLPFNEKSQRFHNKKGQGQIESLKLDLIYGEETWGDEQAQAHQRKMIAILDRYCEDAAAKRPSD